MFKKECEHDFEFSDEDKNIWRIAMIPMGDKPNRYQLIFKFNEKIFSLMKLQSHNAAQTIWELICKIKKPSTQLPVEPQENKEDEKMDQVIEKKEPIILPPENRGRPKKRGVEK